MKKFWASLMLGLAMVGLGAMATPVVPVWADVRDVCDPNNGISDDLKEAAGCTLQKETAIPIAISLIEVAMSIVGILAVIILVYGGITYVISTGDAVKVQRAKNTILYAIVGMVVALLAWTIVHFVSISIWG